VDLAQGLSCAATNLRPYLSFRSVNRKGRPGYEAGLQRHHLLPRQLRVARAFACMFTVIGGERRRFEDFRENGLLLPCDESTALRMAMPPHRGPHRRYSELVSERVGQIKAGWAGQRLRDAETARAGADAPFPAAAGIAALSAQSGLAPARSQSPGPVGKGRGLFAT
jgi:hypothetical protein